LGTARFASQRRGGGQGPGVTEAERRVALEAIATEVRGCNRCRLHQTRTQAVPGEGHPSTEVVFVGEGPGFNEDRLGRPFVGRAGDLLVRHLESIGWRRDEVFITNIVKCRPPENRDPEPDEIAACAPFLRRQLEVLDPALIVTLGRHSMARFMPGARISQAHGTVRPADPETGAPDATVFAMYHPAAALRSTEVERQSYEDMGRVPDALEASRRRRTERRGTARSTTEQHGPEAHAVAISAQASGTPGAHSPAPGVRVRAAVAVAPAHDEPARQHGEPRAVAGSSVSGHGRQPDHPPGDIGNAAVEVPPTPIDASGPTDPDALIDPHAPSDPTDQLPLF
jgi:DNA polymerase